MCYPRRGKKRDKKSSARAIRCCRTKLIGTIKKGNYKKIIAFGKVAYDSTICIQKEYDNIPEIGKARHPSSGVTNKELDNSY